MAKEYSYSWGVDGDYSTLAAAVSQCDSDWGSDDFDDNISFPCMSNAETISVQVDFPSTLNTGYNYAVIIEAGDGYTPVITVDTGAHGITDTSRYLLRTMVVRNMTFIVEAGVDRCFRFHGFQENRLENVIIEVADSGTFAVDASSGKSGYGFIAFDCRIEGRFDELHGARRSKFLKCAGGDRYFGAVEGSIESCYFDWATDAAGDEVMWYQKITDATFVNCVFVGDGNRKGFSYRERYGYGIWSLRVYNCIAQGFTTFIDDSPGDGADYEFMPKYTIEGCCFYDVDTIINTWDGDVITSLSGLQAYGLDTKQASIIADPKLVTPVDGTIESDSPCVEAGVPAGTFVGVNGNTFSWENQHPSIGCDAQHDADDTSDFPDAGNVRDTDTVNGVAGTLPSDKILKSNSVGDGPGNYNDDNLSVGNVRPVAFGIGLTGDLSNLVATDAAYASLENSRNDDNGTVAGDITTGNSIKIRNVTITGSFSPDFPEVENVYDIDTVQGVTGTLKLPGTAQVLDGVIFGPASGLTGTYDAEVPSSDNILVTGANFLATQMLAHAATEITYQRGTDTVNVGATTGATTWEVENELGAVEEIKSRDFFIRASRIILSGGVVVPQRGDIIKETLGAVTYLYEVAAPAGEDHYRYGDHAQNTLRIHTKLRGTE